MVVGLVAETDVNWVVRSLSHSSGLTGSLGISMMLWGPLFDLTWNYVLGVSLVPEMLTSTSLGTGTLVGSSVRVGLRSHLK